jgi:lysozyme
VTGREQATALIRRFEGCRLIGLAALERSTLARRWKRGDVQGAADEFLRWVRAGKRVLPGLAKRREAERQVFLSGGA